MIVVTGASGRIGRQLVTRLAGRGAKVRAVSRHAAPQPELSGVEWVAADLEERSRLVEVFGGAESLFLLTGNDERMVRLQKNALTAAREADVARVVKLSALGASDHSVSVIGLWHYNVERQLRESGFKWTILRPHHFMENILEQRDSIVREGVVYSAAGEGVIPFIDTGDIAAAAAAVLSDAGHDGETYVLTGPEALSYRDATAILSRVMNRPLTYVAESEDEAWTRLRRAGEPAWRIAAQLAIAGYQRRGGATERVTSTVSELTGREPRRFEEVARDRVLHEIQGG